MGEKQNQPFQLSFNASLKVDFQGSRVTSDGGLVLVRELDEHLSQDPTFRLIGSEKIWERGAALTSRLRSFETQLLTQEENLTGLATIHRQLIAKAEAIDSPQRVVLDKDSADIPVYGQQEHSAYNGHFESTCYHPLLLFKRDGDCLAAKLRPGNVHSVEDWEELLLPEIERHQKLGKEVVVRADEGNRQRSWTLGILIRTRSSQNGNRG